MPFLSFHDVCNELLLEELTLGTESTALPQPSTTRPPAASPPPSITYGPPSCLPASTFAPRALVRLPAPGGGGQHNGVPSGRGVMHGCPSTTHGPGPSLCGRAQLSFPPQRALCSWLCRSHPTTSPLHLKHPLLSTNHRFCPSFHS